MAYITETELRRTLRKLAISIGAGASSSVTVEDGVPVASDVDREGDTYFDSTTGNLYIFSSGSWIVSADTLHIRYATEVNNASSSGIVEEQTDVIGFTSNPVAVDGTAQPWRGMYLGNPIAPTSPVAYTWEYTRGPVGETGLPSISSRLAIMSGNPEMANNAGSVTLKAFLTIGDLVESDSDQPGSRINSYTWYYTPEGYAGKVLITNGNVEDVSGTTDNSLFATGNANSGYGHHTIIIEADGLALDLIGAGRASIFCDIDYT